jgi:hypothetical protein
LLQSQPALLDQKMREKIIVLFLALVMPVALSGCGRPAPTVENIQPATTPTAVLAAIQPTGAAIPTETGPRPENPPFPSAPSSNETDGLIDACTLVQADEIESIFPNPPEPTHQAVNDGERKGSVCNFTGAEDTLSIAVAIDLNSISELSKHAENIKNAPGQLHFSSSGADIYLASGHDQTGSGFMGVILRDDVSVEITMIGKSFIFDPERETSLLKSVAGRLPPFTLMVDRMKACSLVKEEEVAALFPNPPEPRNEFKHDKKGLISVCTYANGEMSLTINLGYASKEAVQGLKYSPDLSKILISGAEIYLAGEPSSLPGEGDNWLGVILKGDLMVSVYGSGKAYLYKFERETELLKAMAGRLP